MWKTPARAGTDLRLFGKPGFVKRHMGVALAAGRPMWMWRGPTKPAASKGQTAQV